MTDQHHEAQPRFRYGSPDSNSGQPWSKTDIRDLRASIAHGDTPKDVASFLCRARQEVVRKARELGLKWKPR